MFPEWMYITMSKKKNTKTIRLYLPVILSWCIIIGIPIGIGVAIRFLLPTMTIIVSYIVGILTFLLSLASGDWLLRGLRRILLPDEQEASIIISADQRIAEIISEVMTQEKTSYSRIMRQLDIVDTNSLGNEAIDILKSCVDSSTDSFNQKKIREHWSRLIHLMNILRMS